MNIENKKRCFLQGLESVPRITTEMKLSKNLYKIDFLFSLYRFSKISNRSTSKKADVVMSSAKNTETLLLQNNHNWEDFVRFASFLADISRETSFEKVSVAQISIIFVKQISISEKFATSKYDAMAHIMLSTNERNTCQFSKVHYVLASYAQTKNINTTTWGISRTK